MLDSDTSLCLLAIYIYGQKMKLKIKTAKVEFFLRFSIAIIQLNFKENLPDFYASFK